jgi:hypothetical protein
MGLLVIRCKLNAGLAAVCLDPCGSLLICCSIRAERVPSVSSIRGHLKVCLSSFVRVRDYGNGLCLQSQNGMVSGCSCPVWALGMGAAY